MALATTLKLYLEGLGVAYRLVPHPRSYSAREAAVASHVAPDHIAKGVVLRDERGHLLAAIPGDHWLKLHAVQEAVGRPVVLAAEEEAADRFLDCQPGAIPPVGGPYGLETLCDEALATLARVYFEAGDHEQLVEVSGDGFRRLMSGARRGFFSHPA